MERPSVVQVHDVLWRCQLLPSSMEVLPDADNHHAVLAPVPFSEDLTSEAAQSRIDKIAKVT